MLTESSSAYSVAKGAEPLLRLGDDGRIVTASRITPRVLAGIVRLFEAGITTLTGILVAQYYVHDLNSLWRGDYWLAIGVTGLAVSIALETLGRYQLSAFTDYAASLPRLFLAWVAAFALLVTALFFFKYGPEISRGWVGLWFAIGFAAIAVERLALSYQMRRWAEQGRFIRRAVIYGTGQITTDMIRLFSSEPSLDIRIAGIFDDRADLRSGPVHLETVHGYPVLGGLDDLIRYCRVTRIDLVLVSLPISAEARLADVASKLAVLPADVKVPAKITAIRFSPRTYSHIGPVAMIDLFDQPLAGWGPIFKWLLDKSVAGVALVLLAPVMALIAAAIKLDSSGPVLFRQKRYGFNNELIEVLKFRSMFHASADAEASTLVTKTDSRVTRVGRFLRKSSLDELPQFINVLKGDLSLVGPRPHALGAKAAEKRYDDVVKGYFVRHKVKPGITGWAQINGWRGETDTPEKIEKRVEHDLYYIENWSLLFDIYILLRTPVALVKDENAY
jgi:Undecaprenyl-phosphate glucose phosphotransferase